MKVERRKLCYLKVKIMDYYDFNEEKSSFDFRLSTLFVPLTHTKQRLDEILIYCSCL